MQRSQIGQLDEKVLACRADIFQHVAAIDLFLPGSQYLIEHAQPIANRSVRTVGQQLQRTVGQAHALFRADAAHTLHQQRLRYALEVEAQAPGKNGRREFLRLSGRQNEHHVLRRLFQSFEQCVERAGREHMHLVNDIDLFAADGRRILDALAQLADILDAVVRCRVDLDHVHEGALADGTAVRACTAGSPLRVLVQTVDALGENARGRCLARTARAAE